MGGEGSGECIAQPAGVHRRCVGERKCSARACRCVGASEGLRRGMGREVGGECFAQSAGARRDCVGVRRGCVGERKCSGRACRCAGASEGLRRGMHRAACGRASELRGGAEVLGKGVSLCGGERRASAGKWVVRSAGLTHICRSSTRARVLLYIRPPCPRREIAAMGPKDAPCEYPSPAKAFAPAPSAFALPRPRSYFPRPRSHFPRIAFRGPRRTIGIPQQQLSTMGYPRKSYPHCCSPPCAKRSRPRACARVYIIYRSPVGRSRGGFAPLRKRVRAVVTPCPAPPSAGWGGEGKGGRPLAQCRTMPLVCRITVHKDGSAPGQPRPLPVRSPRGNLPTAAPPPADGRITVRKGGSAQGQPRPRPCVLPATACLRPCPRPLMGEAPNAGWGRAKAKADAPLHSNPPPPPKWAPRLRRREGKRPNGAPPHHNAHTPNATRKRYLHNSRTKTQSRTKRCAQFVIFVFTPCKLLHNFSTVLHRSPRNVPKRAQIAARRPDFPCFTARFPNVLPESHCANHPRTAPVLPPKNALLRAYAKPRPHSRVRGTRQHVTTCAFFTFSARYERIGGT